MENQILSRNPRLHSTRALVRAAEQRGHQVRVNDCLRCCMNIASLKASIF